MIIKQSLHKGFRTKKCGLLINQEYPWIAASPDAVIECDCHGIGVLEAKTCYKHRNADSFEDVAVTDPNFFLSYHRENGSFSLKKEHPYNYQIQQEMLVSKTSFALLVVYIEKDVVVVDVPRDEEIIQEIISKTKEFFLKVLLPQMLSHHYVPTRFDPVIENSNAFYLEDELTSNADCVDVNEPEPSLHVARPSSQNVTTPLSNGSYGLDEPCTSTSDASLIPCSSTTNASLIHDVVIGNGLPGSNLQSSNYKCCDEDPGLGETVSCCNPLCLVGTYHKKCAKPQLKVYRKDWKCSSCRELVKRSNKRKGKVNDENANHNATQSRKGKKAGNVLQSITNIV